MTEHVDLKQPSQQAEKLVLRTVNRLTWLAKFRKAHLPEHTTACICVGCEKERLALLDRFAALAVAQARLEEAETWKTGHCTSSWIIQRMEMLERSAKDAGEKDEL